jgi:GMP synthase-like glutamine amidotransferase
MYFIYPGEILVRIMKVVAFQHAPQESLGYFESFFTERNIPFEYIRLDESPEIPGTEATHLIFLGGPMSVNDEREYPYLKQEKELIRKSVKRGNKVLGICLGAQLIASAFGAKVYPYVNETGWHQIRCDHTVDGVFRQFPETFPVFQLHGETFEIPYGGRLACTGSRVKNQAFVFRNALGLQFHLELTEEKIRTWSRDLNRYQRDKIARETPRYLSESTRLCRLIAEDFVSP